MSSPGDAAVEDLKRVIVGALATNGALLTAGERSLAEALLALHGDPARLYARLVVRKGDCFRVPTLSYADVGDLGGAVSSLLQADLVHCSVPWDRRLPLYTVKELKAVCGTRGMVRSGPRKAIEERLKGQVDWSDERVIRVVGKELVRRLEILWFRSPRRDRKTMVLERLGRRRWADYALTAGGRTFTHRAQFGSYLAALRDEASDPEALLELVRGSQPRSPWLRGVDPRRVWVKRLQAAARLLEAEEGARAAHAYRGLLEAGLSQPGPAARRLALVLEALGEAAEGARLCTHWAQRAQPQNRPGLLRTGRRLSRKAGLSWAPARPLRKAPERRLELTRAQDGRWESGQGIEAAVLDRIAARRALHGENVLWTTLFGLVFLDLYWLPVRGMLPAPYLAGPLDLGTPAFLEHRRAAIEARLKEALPSVVRRNHRAYEGRVVSGVRWSIAPLDILESLAEAGRPILWRLLREGWAAARGLPDLTVLPGARLRVEGLFPGRLGEDLLLVEVKGPGDELRDAQRVWHDALAGAGLSVEVWRVESTGGLRAARSA